MKFFLVGIWLTFSLNMHAQNFNWIAGNKVIKIDTNGNVISEQPIFENNTIPEIVDAPTFADGSCAFALNFPNGSKIKYLTNENGLLWENNLENFYARCCLAGQGCMYITGSSKPGFEGASIIKMDTNGKTIWEKKDQELTAILKGHPDFPFVEKSTDTSINKQPTSSANCIIKTKNGNLLVCGHISINKMIRKDGANELEDLGHTGWVVLLDNDGNIKWSQLLPGETSTELYSITETDHCFIAVGNKFKNRNINTYSHIVILDLDKNDGKILKETDTNEFGGPGISNLVTISEGSLFGVRDNLFILKEGQIDRKKIFYLGQNGKRNFSAYLKKLITTENNDLIIVADLNNDYTLIEKSIFKLDKDFLHSTWKKERRYRMDNKKIDQKIYAFKLFNNNATKAKQNIKANHKISGRDFVGTWLCDGCDEKFTFFKDGAFSGNDKNSNLEGRWEYDQQHQLLVYDGRHSKTWRRVDELGEGYFIIGGYYFYKLD